MPPADWDFYTALPNNSNRGQLLTQARNRSVTFDLKDPHNIQFTINGKHPEATIINELATDIIAVRNGTTMFRGRVTTSNDNVTQNTHSVSYGAVAYKGLLMRREINTAYSTIDDIADREYGFDWDIDSSLAFKMYYPIRGNYVPFVAQYPGNVSTFTRSIDTTYYANSVRAIGTNSGVTVTSITSASDIGTRAEGRWDYVEGGGDADSTAEVLSLARGILADRAALIPSYELRMKAGSFDPSECWIGDTIRVVIKIGRLNVNTVYRIQRINFDIGDSGEEDITVSVGAPVMSISNRLWFYGRRITELERR